MKVKLSLLILLLIPLQGITGQSKYNVEKTKFSSNKQNEFCPVFYGDRIVFCFDIEDDLFINYQTKAKNGLFNLFSVSQDEAYWGEKPEIFSSNILTPLNDGPISFSADGRLLVYSRNIDVKTKLRDVSDSSNTLGLYFAELVNGEWTNLTPFKYNSNEYSITTPCFSSDGQYLYFCSNMPGGFGGTDIFRSELFEGNWSEPENLGEVINTGGNEGYPFIAYNGDLYFASDGHGGLGGKDILVTRWKKDGWLAPTNMQAPINSIKQLRRGPEFRTQA
ncbi:MAG: hypothetical protein HGA25_10085 [Clostridiales bacterium]|nr:hypothetical protein [Clostridiales bacterium]